MGRRDKLQDSFPTPSELGLERPGTYLRLAVGMLGAVGMSLLGWNILSLAIADHYAAVDPQFALRWDPDNRVALSEAAEAELVAGGELVDWESVRKLTEPAIVLDPLSPVPLRLAALASEAAGKHENAEALMTLAGLRSRRDVRTQVWLLQRRIAEEDFSGAAADIDGLLRIRPQAQSDLFPLLIQMAAYPDSRGPLVVSLQQNPPWRGAFLSQLRGQVSDPNMLLDIYRALSTGPAPPSSGELNSLFHGLVEQGRAGLAYSAWLGYVPEEQLPMISNVNNGEFEFPLDGSPFNWTLEKVTGATSKIASEISGSKALSVEFHNTRVRFQHVRQTLVLRPGQYTLKGRVKSIDLRNERGLQWVLTCVGKPELIGETERFFGSEPWKEFASAFKVSAEGCEAQVLSLRIAARIPSEQEIAGQIWFDSLSAERVTDGAAAELTRAQPTVAP